MAIRKEDKSALVEENEYYPQTKHSRRIIKWRQENFCLAIKCFRLAGKFRKLTFIMKMFKGRFRGSGFRGSKVGVLCRIFAIEPFF